MLPVLLALAACGTKTADRPGLEDRARALGTEAEMVYVTELPGYSLAVQSVGVRGENGFGSSYVRVGGRTIDLRVDVQEHSPVGCVQPGTFLDEGETVICERDGEDWYRATRTTHEYVREDAGRVIRLSALRNLVTRDTLRSAVRNLHQADDGELAEILPKNTGSNGGAGGIERGDLPTSGDGPPQDPPGFTEGTSG